jgi:hypothetical protein
MFKVKDDTFEHTECNVRSNASGIGIKNVFRVHFEKVRYHSQGRDFQQRAQVIVRQELLDSKDAEIPLMMCLCMVEHGEVVLEQCIVSFHYRF